MKKYKQKQHQDLERTKPTLLAGYKFNSFANRRVRRQTAKSSGYFSRDQQGHTLWPQLRAQPDNNVQTVRLTDATII